MNDIDWKSVTDEAIEYLVEMVKFDTTNPPGNELECAQYLGDLLSKEGIEPLVLESEPRRGNVIGKLKGDGSKKPLLLMSHLDVVHAESSRWEVPPFSGEIRNGDLWGRGTLDMKGLSIMHLMSMFLLKRQGAPLKRDIIFMGNADEEAGGRLGAQWVVDNHFDKVESEFVLTEGGTGMSINDKTVFLCANAEKGMTWGKLNAKGTPGHGSLPHDDNATLHMSRAIEKLAKHQPEIVLTDTFNNFVDALTSADSRGYLLKLLGVPGVGRLILKMIKEDFIRVMVQSTITPTAIKGGVKVNVIPDSCELMLDCRILPGVTREGLERRILDIVDSEKIDLEFEIFSPASESKIQTKMFSIVDKVTTSNFPDSVVSSFMLPGGTDARFLRWKGISSYGFMPVVLNRDDIASIHGDNEKISIEGFSSGLRAMYHIVAETCL